jgi:hypothetical protein
MRATMPETMMEDYATELIDKLVKHYHVCLNYRYTFDSDRSRVNRNRKGDITLIISVPHLLEHKWSGFLEYHRLRKYVPNRFKGMAGIHQHVLHEFAHVLALVHDGQHTHNAYFVKWYLKLMKQFPYKEDSA